MEASHPPKEVKETIDDSAVPETEGISKWLREKIDSLIPVIQENGLLSLNKFWKLRKEALMI